MQQATLSCIRLQYNDNRRPKYSRQHCVVLDCKKTTFEGQSAVGHIVLCWTANQWQSNVEKTFICFTKPSLSCKYVHWYLFGDFIHSVILWRHLMEPFPRCWPFVKGIHWSPVDSPHEDQWRGALMFSLICVWTNGWANNRDANGLRRHHTDYDVTVMMWAASL